jgi:ribosome-binding protein aMBF1 (putative translation factor)
MSVRFQKTARGEIAILPRKEYERLVARASEAAEDEGTARIVARARKEIASGSPLLPKDIVDRLADGENPIRVLRKWRERESPGGMTQMYLSFKTGLSQGYISDIENGRRKGTAAALRQIANALKVSLDLLVQEKQERA